MERSRYTDVLGWVPFRRSDCPWVGPSYALSTTREFQVPAALAGLLTTTTAVDMATVAMPLDLGFGDISHKVIFELAGRFEILGTAMGTLLRTDVVFGEYGPWW